MDLLESPKLPKMLRHLNSTDFKKFNNNFKWNGSHVTTAIRYVQKTRPADDISIHLLERLEDSRDTHRYPKMVLSLMDKLREFFTVPKMDYYKTNEVLTSFLDFLLDTVEEISKSQADYIEPVEEEMQILQSQLKLLIAILGDAPFRRTDIDKTICFLKEMEALANEVGVFLYLYFFTDEGEFTRLDVSLSKLLNKLELAEAKIKEHIISASQSQLTSRVLPHNASTDSLFIVDCLLNDLKDLPPNWNDDVLGDQVTTLKEELVLARSFILVGNLKDHKQLSTKIRDVAFEAGYIIDSYVLDNVPAWYLSRRLADLIQAIRLTGIGLEEFKKNCDAKCTISSVMVGDIPVWYPTPMFPSIVNKKKTNNTFVKAPKNGESNVPHQKEEVMVGFKKEVENICQQLYGGPKELQVVFICGMPGLGKTTLAKKLYNHPSFSGHFDRRAWCVASQAYKRKTLLMDILNLVSDIDYDYMFGMDDDKLGVELHKNLTNRRYLIIVDDIWNLNVWDDVRRYLPDNINGSRVLFTSRNKDMAPTGSIIHSLPLLSVQECWDLLKKKVFPKENEDCPQDLADTGKQIAVYCHGLPLAVVVIAAVLENMDKKKRLWDEVVGNLNSQLSKDPNKCMNILELSYNHLPGHLKPCFLYFGAFPEVREISVRKLTSLWIAEGFVEKQVASKHTLQEVAEGYLANLINRNLVQATKRRSDDGVKTCATHDLLRLLCLRKAEEENFLSVVQGKFSVYEQNHRLRITLGSSNDVVAKAFFPHARSLLGRWSNISDSYSRLKRLRILDLSSRECPHDLPAEDDDDINLRGIEHMLYLRHLEVRLTAPTIPITLCKLYNLKFLYFDGCGKVEIPKQLLHLVKLRHLHVRPHATFHKSFHTKAIKLKFMETISSLDIVDVNDEIILKHFTNLRRLKCSTNSLWDSLEKCRRYPVLNSLTRLESLNMSYLTSELKFKDTLQFPQNIKKLTLNAFKLSWEEMSIIGELPTLQVLKLASVVFVGKQWTTNDEQFLELKMLKLDGLRIQKWITFADHFPSIERLVMTRCWKLKAFPAELGESATLQTIDIHLCAESFAKSAMQVQKYTQKMGGEFKLNITGTQDKENDL